MRTTLPADQARASRFAFPVSTEHLIGWFRLLRIDLRRGGGFWLLPGGIAFAWLILRGALTPGVALWPEISSAIGRLYLPLSLLALLVGAFAGARERRRATAELTIGTALSPWLRFMSLALSLVVWALVVYVAVALPLVVYGAGWATWGGPEVGVMVVGLPVIALAALWGVLIGRWLGGGRTPGLALAFFLLIFVVLPGAVAETRALSLTALNGWHEAVVEGAETRPFNVWAQLAWGAGLAGVLAGIALWREARTPLSATLLVGSLAVALAGEASILGAGYSRNTMSSGQAMTAIPAGAICDETQSVRVCVHPAYERLLPDLADEINTLVGPMAGLEGVVDEVYISSGKGVGGGSWANGHAISSVDLTFQRDRSAMFAKTFRPWTFWPLEGDGRLFDQAQYVVMSALAKRIGVDAWPEQFRFRSDAMRDAEATGDADAERRVVAEEAAAIDCFAALAPEDQRAWLVANWDALTAGEVTLEDFP